MTLSKKTTEQVFFLALLVLVTLAFYDLVDDFFRAIFWAAILALMFRPVHQWLVKVMPNWPALNALLTTLAIVVAVLIPVSFVAIAVAQEAANLARDIETGNIDTESTLLWLEQRIPFLPTIIERFQIDLARIQEGLSAAAIAAGRWVAGNAVTIGQNALQFFLRLFVMLYLLFFFIKDGKSIMLAVARVLPLDMELQQNLKSRFANVARATLKGTFLISAIQGLIGGISFWALDIRAPILWGVVMAVFALIPAVGPAIVWLPAAIILLASGEVAKGLILIGIGAVVIGLVDNLLRPVLVGRDARLPDYIILLTTLGGITVFGLSGVLIGPIIAALFFTVWTSLGDRQQLDGAIAGEGTNLAPQTDRQAADVSNPR
jgi:predicted PurR-regulated permease PerM